MVFRLKQYNAYTPTPDLI